MLYAKPMTERVNLTVNEGVAQVRLSRSEKLNALDRAMFAALVDAGQACIRDKGVRAVVIHGEGRAFCAGLDFGIFAEFGKRAEGAGAGPTLLQRSDESPANLAQRVSYIWQEVPVPVIAAVHGVAYGGGLQIALGADMRYMHPDARLSVREIEWGIIPDMAGTQMLRHLVGLDVAKELTFTGRVINGIDAKILGLATQLSDDPLQTALSVAREIASKSPDAIRAAKRLLNESVHLSVQDGLRLEEQLQLSLMGRPNQLEAVSAGLQKRRAQFRDPS